MFLSKQVDTINQYFVPVYVNWAILLPQNKEIYARMVADRITYRRRHPGYPPGPNHAWILRPDGKIEEMFHVTWMEGVHNDPDFCKRRLDAAISRLGLRPGATLTSYRPLDLRAMQGDDIALHIAARFLIDDTLASTDSRTSVGLDAPPMEPFPGPLENVGMAVRFRLTVPIDEWLVLPSAQWKQLLPPPAASVGTTYAMSREVADPIARRLCPPTHNHKIEGKVLSNEMQGLVRRVEGSRVTVYLSGRFTEEHHFWGKPDVNVAQAEVRGVMVCDTATGRIVSLEMITDPGVFGDGKGFRLPYAATARLEAVSPAPPDAIGLAAP